MERGLVAQETLTRARLIQAETGERLDSVLTRLGMIAEQTLASAIAKETGLPIASSSDFPAERILGDAISARFLRDVKAVPIAETEEAVDVALIDPLDPYPLEALAFALQREIRPKIAKANDVEAALDRLYGGAAQMESDAESVDDADVERLKDLASDAPVVRTVNNLIARASEARASDIHIEPAEDCVRVRYRVDGALVDIETLPAQMKLPLVSRIKVMASLDIAERRLPQDGRLRVAVRGHEIDLRIATSPTIHGESVVMRILDRSNLSLDFKTLGFEDDVLEKFLHVLKQPHGIVLVTGPTGSGKTTTLYASLAAINSPDRKILTIEDPIEYRLAGINQTQVKPQIGLTFAAALAFVPAPGPGRDDGRRNPRSGNRGSRNPVSADRPHHSFDTAHQQRRSVGDASDRYGRRAVPDYLDVECRSCAASGSPALSEMPRDVRADAGISGEFVAGHRCEFCQAAVPAQGLRGLWTHRFSRPSGGHGVVARR